MSHGDPGNEQYLQKSQDQLWREICNVEIVVEEPEPLKIPTEGSKSYPSDFLSCI
jgi:hypothetical protein